MSGPFFGGAFFDGGFFEALQEIIVIEEGRGGDDASRKRRKRRKSDKEKLDALLSRLGQPEPAPKVLPPARAEPSAAPTPAPAVVDDPYKGLSTLAADFTEAQRVYRKALDDDDEEAILALT